jgi:hypothetical protein
VYELMHEQSQSFIAAAAATTTTTTTTTTCTAAAQLVRAKVSGMRNACQRFPTKDNP